MSERVRLRRMVLLDGAGFALSALILLVFFPGQLESGLIGYGIGALSALCGFVLIELQYHAPSRYWNLLVIPCFFIRMLLYGLGFWLCLLLQANLFLFVLGVSLSFGSLILDARR